MLMKKKIKNFYKSENEEINNDNNNNIYEFENNIYTQINDEDNDNDGYLCDNCKSHFNQNNINDDYNNNELNNYIVSDLNSQKEIHKNENNNYFPGFSFSTSDEDENGNTPN